MALCLPSCRDESMRGGMSFVGGFKKDKHVAAGFSVFALLISLGPP